MKERELMLLLVQLGLQRWQQDPRHHLPVTFLQHATACLLGSSCLRALTYSELEALKAWLIEEGVLDDIVLPLPPFWCSSPSAEQWALLTTLCQALGWDRHSAAFQAFMQQVVGREHALLLSSKEMNLLLLALALERSGASPLPDFDYAEAEA